jgi:hypothetical protein
MDLPEIRVESKELFQLQSGAIRSWLLITAVEFNLFTHTAEKRTAAEIASILRTHGPNTELFLNALCSLGLLRKEHSAYINTELADTFLVEGKESYLGGFLLLNEQWNLRSREQMKTLIQNGPIPAQESSDVPEAMFSQYIKEMRNFARSGVSQLVVKEIERLPEFPKLRRMLDLGGAHGMDAIAIVNRNSSLSGVVFDKPAIVKYTRDIIREYHMEERITTIGGDYILDPIGDGYDLIFTKGTLNFAKDQLASVCEKIYTALAPGGIFVSLHEGLTDEDTKPAGMVLSWLPSCLASTDLSLSRDDIPNAMIKAGFTRVRTKPFPFPLGGVLDLTIGRK